MSRPKKRGPYRRLHLVPPVKYPHRQRQLAEIVHNLLGPTPDWERAPDKYAILDTLELALLKQGFVIAERRHRR